MIVNLLLTCLFCSMFCTGTFMVMDTGHILSWWDDLLQGWRDTYPDSDLVFKITMPLGKCVMCMASAWGIPGFCLINECLSLGFNYWLLIIAVPTISLFNMFIWNFRLITDRLSDIPNPNAPVPEKVQKVAEKGNDL